jgi:hypothetical protein
MSNLSFSSLHVNNLSINNTYSLIKSSIDISIPVKTELGEMLNAVLAKLIADNENFGHQINKNQKSGLTDALEPLDKERDDLQADTNRTITFFLKSADAAKKAAAHTLKLFLTPYWNAARLPLNTQTDVTAEMLAKYKANPNLLAAAQALGMLEQFASIEVKNKAFDTLYKSRNEELAGRQTSGSSLKPAAVASYIQYCTALEQAANFTPNAAIITLFNNMDMLRKKYHALGGSGKDTPVEGEK